MDPRLRARLTFLALGAVIAVAFGCSSDDGGTGPGGSGGDPIMLPLTVGNSWIYETTTTALRGPASVDTTEVTNTALIEGDLYYLLETREPGFVDSTFVRQAGQELLLRPPASFCTFLGGGIDQWLCDVLVAALPWEFADFNASSGAKWTIAQAETTVDKGPTSQTYGVLIEGTSRGRTSITVPAGTFTDVYQGDVDFSITIDGAAVESEQQTFWFKDGVGLVRQRNVDVTDDGGGPMTTTDDSQLVSYQLN